MAGFGTYQLATLALCLAFAASVGAVETQSERLEKQKNVLVDKSKQAYRKIDDQACELVNGKTRCFPKKVKSKLLNAKDKIETETSSAINKVDRD